MEECLRTFIEEELISDPTTDSDSIARFVHKQLVEIAQDIQIRAEQDNLSAVYFYDITQNIERLLNEAREKSPAASLYLSGVAHQLLMIISRPARLLECLEFDPTEFYFMLEAAEDEAKRNLSAHQDTEIYYIQARLSS